MTAALLREAAQTLRERAEAAQISPGSWYDAHDLAEALAPQADIGTDLDADGEFIALMDPTVALAVADWLDAEAAIWEALLTMKAEVSPKGYSLTWGESTQPQALAVARAVLRRES